MEWKTSEKCCRCGKEGYKLILTVGDYLTERFELCVECNALLMSYLIDPRAEIKLPDGYGIPDYENLQRQRFDGDMVGRTDFGHDDMLRQIVNEFKE